MRFARTLPSLLLLAFVLLFSVAPGCGAGPEPPAAEELRRSFPEQAAAVLERREVFTPTAEGFVSSGADGAPIAGADLRAALPQRGHEAIALHVPVSDFKIKVHEVDATGDGVVAGGAVTYARPHGSSFWAANDAGVEEWLMLEAGVAHAGNVVASWVIDGGSVREDSGVISISDAAGVPRIRVTAPAAFGAGGRPVSATLAAHGTTIDLTVDANDEAVLVDPLWVATTSMSVARYAATATVLPGGKVLVVGGSNGVTTLGSCEIYDPMTGVWTLTGSLATARSGHTAVLLGNGKVLIAGGGGGLASAELFDPTVGIGTWTSGGNMTGTRLYHAMALVGTGNAKVLVTGGLYNGALSAAADLYDPVANSWSAAAPMGSVRKYHTLTFLSGPGKVLAAGGNSAAGTSYNTAELYTPGNNTWAATPNMPSPREAHTATVLANGKVLTVAGINWFTSSSGQIQQTTALYDPVAGTWAGGGNLVKYRQDHQTVLLPNGGVITIGGSGAEPGVEFYDVAANSWSNAGPLLTGRGYFVAAPLPGGKVLVAGGYSSAYIATAEIYTPYAVPTVCTSPGECLSGFCVDGVCCSTACTGLCQACSAAKTGGANGTCGNVTVATDPDNDCAAQATSTCGTNGSCDGTGKCQLYVSGTSCAAASCAGNTLTNASTCNGGGTCVPGSTQSCGNYLCVVGACPTTCTLATDCTAGNLCISNQCVAPLPIGSLCSAANQCASGFCADGVCCVSACGGLCQACSAAKTGGANGTCGSVTTATDPDNECTAQAASTCGTNGSCNGGGACQLYANGTSCLAASCSGSTLTSASTCNGSGTCVPGSTSSCGNYLCNGAVCGTTCATAANCTAGNVCIGNQCVAPLPISSVCTTNSQCASGFCTDGFCCGSACGGLCQSCSAAKTGGTNGTCGSVTIATDPDNECATQAATTCGTIGTCNGAGACTQYAAGTSCVAPSCMGTTLNKGSSCDGTGTCTMNGTVSCAPYGCALGACKSICLDDTDCSVGNLCINGVCGSPLPDGTACGTSAQCQSANCVDGVCCNTACNAGACDACSKAAGGPVDGVCSPLSGNACDDGNVCTQNDTCMLGACMAGSPVQCAAIDMCHTAGVCDPAMKGCTNPLAVDGTSCVDKNGCTQNDTCKQGVCVGGPVCPSTDACQVGSCNALGTCDYAPVADGAPCDDGNLCTQTDKCAAGACAGTNPVVCAPADNCHAEGSCVMATGVCNPGATLTPPCAVDPFCETIVSTCDNASGLCVKAAKPDGTPCNVTGECLAGTCLGGAGTGSAGTGSASTGSASTGSASTGSASTGSASTGAGTGSAGTASTSSAGVGGSGSTGVSGGGGNSGDGTVSPAGGCGCTTASTSESRAPWLLLGLVLVASRRRRQRLTA